MLKKRLGLNAIEVYWMKGGVDDYFKIPTTLIIPEGCESIGYCAFFRCYKLKRVVIPESVKRIGAYAFYCCDSTDIIVKKPKIKGYKAFEGCKDVKEKTRN